MAKTKTTKASDSELATIRKVLEDVGLLLQPFEREGQRGFVVSLDSPLYEAAVAYIVEAEHRFVFTIELAGRARAAQRAQVAEFIARANYGMLIGNFELDFGDGTARFRAGLDYEGAVLSKALVKNLASAAFDACDVYGEALADVMQGIVGAAEAIEAAEARVAEPESRP